MGKLKRRSPRSFRSDEQSDCAVCGRLTRAYFYKLYVCCACTMFYRRNFRSYPRAQCRFRDESCNLKSGPRRFCLRCRLSACRSLGLRMWGKNLVVQANGMPVDDIPEEKLEVVPLDSELDVNVEQTQFICSPASSSSSGCSSSGYSSASSSIFDEPSVVDEYLQFLNYKAVELPTLKKMTNLFRQFDDQQKFISSYQQKSEIFDYTVTDLMYMDHVQFKELEPKILKLSANLITGFLSQFSTTQHTTVQIVKEVMYEMSFYHKIIQTIRQYPVKSSELSLFSGYYSDLTDLENYFVDVVDTPYYHHVCNTLHLFINNLYCLVDEARKMQLHPVEISYLLGQTIFGYLEPSESASMFAHNLSMEFWRYFEINYSTADRFLCLTTFSNSVKNLIITYKQAVEEISAISDAVMAPVNGELDDNLILNMINLHNKF
ncbi:unnamed protein product [Bursaphelenchus okinawaensis]|uniref:Nuclear receptor domain-containing protein n=1 Tax=Bursaphelenchus okinawaensis TaxID=465554 RepID=A0A811KXG3_9BILA|nr:unnamed protein product [Bursaphelenchus okinawaensis]CAG9113827.1 unnamed protein product [Bursaphelenchus okinawaensis]